MRIEIQGLTKRYRGGFHALSDVDLEIGSGMFGLLGPNGAGKTTLIRILVTLLKATSGRVLVAGLDVDRHRAQVRRMVSYLPQEFSRFPRLAAWEVLDYQARLRGLGRRQRAEAVDRLLELVGLFEVRDRQAGKLSGGMKRRLGIAQTLVGDPSILVVDEPTVGLDPQERLRFRNLLADLARGEMVILLSTHIVGDISSTCTDMALLSRGRIAYQGSPEGLIDSARGRVWKVAATDAELDGLKERFAVVSTVPSVAGYEVRLVADEPPAASAEAAAPGLEDAYLHHLQSIEPEGGSP